MICKLFLSCLLYIVSHVTSGIGRQGLTLLIGTNRVGLGLSEAGPQNTISGKSKVMDICYIRTTTARTLLKTLCS
jgi:hypothetical protein